MLAQSMQFQDAFEVREQDLDHFPNRVTSDHLSSGWPRTHFPRARKITVELWAAGWSDPEIARLIRDSIRGWMDLLTNVARRAEKELGPIDPFRPEDISSLVGAAFIGAEAFLLLDTESKRVPIRRALRRIGEAIRRLEKPKKK